MKTGLLGVLIMSAAVALADVPRLNRAVSAPDGSGYDVMAEAFFEGHTGNTGEVVDGFVYFLLKTPTDVVLVQLGPSEFVSNKPFKLTIGERLSVVGAPAIVRGRDVILAREIRTATTVFVLRDRHGEPMWNTDRPIQMDTDFPEDAIMCEMVTP